MSETIRIEGGVYGGSGLAHTEDGRALFVPFALLGELVEASAPNAGGETQLLRVLEPASARVEPGCPHFGICGGCHYQMAAYDEQLRLKRSILEEILQRTGVTETPAITMHSAEPWRYRNRVRLRIEHVDGAVRFGYNVRGTTNFLPIITCPISPPLLLQTAKALLASAAVDRDTAFWLDAAAEVELFCSDDLARVQLTLLCAPRTKAPPNIFLRMMHALASRAPQVVGAAAIAADPRTGPTGRTLAESGSSGLVYRVADETYWITRGGFFQVNRFLLETLIGLVCKNEGRPRSGSLAWDLYAGVGLFSRMLARNFARVTAVEANPTAAADLRVSLGKLSPGSNAVEATTLEFLRRAVLELIVLDPPRAGAGLKVCDLLTRLAPDTIVYVSCDPTTLARDLHALQPHFRIAALHMVDLFPQTFHLESVAILERTS